MQLVNRPPVTVSWARPSRAQAERMTAWIDEDDEVGGMVAAGCAAGTDGFGVRRGSVKIVHFKIEVELLWYRIVRPGGRPVIER